MYDTPITLERTKMPTCSIYRQK